LYNTDFYKVLFIMDQLNGHVEEKIDRRGVKKSILVLEMEVGLE
jgi:hypothetical protein